MQPRLHASPLQPAALCLQLPRWVWKRVPATRTSRTPNAAEGAFTANSAAWALSWPQRTSRTPNATEAAFWTDSAASALSSPQKKASTPEPAKGTSLCSRTCSLNRFWYAGFFARAAPVLFFFFPMAVQGEASGGRGVPELLLMVVLLPVVLPVFCPSAAADAGADVGLGGPRPSSIVPTCHALWHWEPYALQGLVILSCTWPPLSTAYEQAVRTSWRLLSEKQLTACTYTHTHTHTRDHNAQIRRQAAACLPLLHPDLGQHDGEQSGV